MGVTDFIFTHTHSFDFTFDVDVDVYDEYGKIVTETITDTATSTATVHLTTLSVMKNDKIVKTSIIDKGKIVESEDSKKPN